MNAPHFTIFGGDYEHTLALSGLYHGVHLSYEATPVQKIFVPMLESRCFEICEFSLANYLTLRAAGETWLTAVPVFPMRAFRHGLVTTRKESPLESLDALAGKRVGVEDYSMTAAVWFRGLLHEEYGVDLKSITWVTRAKQRFPFPTGARVEKTEGALEDLLCDGGIDAMLAVGAKDARLPPQQRRLRPVLRDVVAAERTYYERTGIYPINHTAVIRHDVLEGNPETAAAVYSAYQHAKERAYARQLGTTLVPWGALRWTRTFEVFGGDPLPYGLDETNRLVMGRLARYLREQGFIAEEPDLDSVFVTPS
jgi:4,5-dihydroxyphthalate decarboxylase